MNPAISHARLLELVAYDPQTGIFTNLITRGARAVAGSVCGSSTRLGYIETCLDRERVLGHRLAWFYVHGRWPEHQIDHIDGNPSNNRIDNLRDVPGALNQQNMKPMVQRSGLPGAYRVRDRFKALIRVAGKTVHLGYFDTAEKANRAYLEAKRAHHPGFVGRGH